MGKPPSEMPEPSIVTLTTEIGCLRARIQSCKARSSSLDVPESSTSVDIISCLNVPFGNIPYRWAAPVPSPVPWAGIRDCTKFGPQCPQAKDSLFGGHDLPVFGSLDQGSFPVQGITSDEFKCLNLNIFASFGTVRDGTRGGKKLPVLVWAHGGAYWTGCGGVELYDASEIVARSVRLGSPLIVVTYNYRLGVLGFLHSRELLLDAQSQSNVPPEFRSTANLGVLDTYSAFEWVKEHIGTFGGDSNNITGMGESAGSAILNLTSLLKHLHLKIPRMILSSSTVFSNQPLTSSEAQIWFDKICNQTGVAVNLGDPVTALRTLDVEDLIESTNFARIAFRPTFDGITISYDPRRAIFDSSLWDDRLEEIVIGHCENESLLRLATHHGAVPALQNTLNGRIPPVRSLRARAMKLYGEQSPSGFMWFGEPDAKDKSLAALSWLALDSHARYYAVTQLLSESFVTSRSFSAHPRTMYKYIFSWVPQFWPKDWPATHTADILPMFLHRGLSLSELEVAHTFVDPLIYFAAGSKGDMLWKQYGADEHARKLNAIQRNGKWKVINEDSGEFGLRTEIVDLWRDVIEASLEIGMEGWDGIIR